MLVDNDYKRLQLLKIVQNKRVHALRGGWILIGIAAPKLQKSEGLCIKGQVNNNWIAKKKCKNIRVYA